MLEDTTLYIPTFLLYEITFSCLFHNTVYIRFNFKHPSKSIVEGQYTQFFLIHGRKTIKLLMVLKLVTFHCFRNHQGIYVLFHFIISSFSSVFVTLCLALLYKFYKISLTLECPDNVKYSKRMACYYYAYYLAGATT